ncbi:AEC family transporter [Clostridioides difficile]|nr:AEC family transporter [Clostridioides difficile]HBH3805991.1 AEC family transporter [Clostridioides difficile]
MENLILSINVVLPLFLTMSLGYVLKKLGLFDTHTLNKMNNVCFKSFLPLLLFFNIYNTDLDGSLNFKLMAVAVIIIFSIFLILVFIIPKIEKDNKTRGALIQGVFRSNFVIFGIPVTISLFGDKSIGVTSLLIAVIVPMFNVLSVVIIEIFRGGKVNIRHMIKSVLTNPLIIASFIGLTMLILNINIPTFLHKTIGDISKIATPLSLIILGGSFSFSAIKGHIKPIILGVCGKLILVPAIFLPISIFLGFRNVELASLMIMLSAPTAVSSFTMAQQMDSDSELAGQIVVFTSGFSIITVFLIIFILKQNNLI